MQKDDFFEKIRGDWKEQPSPEVPNREELLKKVKMNYQTQQQKIWREALSLTFTFGATFGVFAGVWIAFPNRSIWFYLGLILCALVMLGFGVAQWLMVQKPVGKSPLHTRAYARQAIRKLQIRLWIQQYGIYTYMVVLYLGLSFYFADLIPLFSNGWLISLVMYGGTLGFFIIVLFFSQNKMREYSHQAQNLIEEWKSLLEEE